MRDRRPVLRKFCSSLNGNICVALVFLCLCLSLFFHQSRFIKDLILKRRAYVEDSSGNFEEANRLYRLVYARNTDDLDLLLAYCGFLKRQGRTREALELYLNSEKHIASMDVQIAIGDLYLTLGNIELAILHFWRAREFAPGKVTPICRLARCYIDLDDKVMVDSLFSVLDNGKYKHTHSTSLVLEQIRYLRRKKWGSY